MTLAEKIRFARTQLNLTQKAVAEIIGVAESHYQSWEAGRYIPETKNLIKISKALKKELSWFVMDN